MTPNRRIVNFYPNIPRGVILQNRINWHEYLQHPDTKRHAGGLESLLLPGARCCLGHACHTLAVPREVRLFGGVDQVHYGGDFAYAPQEAMRLLGLITEDGRVFSELPDAMIKAETGRANHTLAGLNDERCWLPQKIGALLETMVEGGPGTPYFPLTAYRA